MEALIDGDIVCYRAAAVTENEDLGLAIYQTETTLKRILEDTNAESHKIYLTGSDNFRYRIYPEYKANRRDKPRPKHWNAVKEYLIKEWDAKLSYGCEADDELGINQTDTSIICSIDKDLRQVPGNHYNWVKREINVVDHREANYNFWYQMLVGDRTDNLTGIKGCGPVGATKLLESSGSSINDLPEKVLGRYLETSTVDEFILNAQCLWIWRERDDIWNPLDKMRLDINLTYLEEQGRGLML